jgi:hypothetical protein
MPKLFRIVSTLRVSAAALALVSAMVVACHGFGSQIPPPENKPVDQALAVSGAPDSIADSDPVRPQSTGEDVSRSPASNQSVAFEEMRAILLEQGLLAEDELTEQGLVDLEEDIVSGLTSVWKRRAELHPTSPNYKVALAAFNASEAMMSAELADLKDGHFLLVNEEFTKRQFWLQRSHPDYLFVLMSPKASRQGHAYVAFCLDLKHRHRAVQETRELRRAAQRAQNQ